MDLPVCSDCGCRAHLDQEGRCALCVFRQPLGGDEGYRFDAERDRALERFGRFSAPENAYSVLLEEMDDLYDQIKAHRYDRDYWMVATALELGVIVLRVVVQHLEQRPDVARDVP